MTKTVLGLAVLAAIGFSGAAFATTTMTTTKASVAMSGSEIVVAQNADNQGFATGAKAVVAMAQARAKVKAKKDNN